MKFGKQDMKLTDCNLNFWFVGNVRMCAYMQKLIMKRIEGDTVNTCTDIRNENHSQKRKMTCSTIYAIWFWCMKLYCIYRMFCV